MIKYVINIFKRTLTLICERQHSLRHGSSAEVQTPKKHRRLLSASPEPLELSTYVSLSLSLSLALPQYFPSAPLLLFHITHHYIHSGTQCFAQPATNLKINSISTSELKCHVNHFGQSYNHKPCNYLKNRGGSLQFNTFTMQ